VQNVTASIMERLLQTYISSNQNKLTIQDELLDSKLSAKFMVALMLNNLFWITMHMGRDTEDCRIDFSDVKAKQNYKNRS
jgi:hypothetical protein